MEIHFNGEVRTVPEGITVEQLLAEIGVRSRYCAVEVNWEIVPRSDFSHQQLQPGDAVEVVTLVGGG
jgi:sulfur carrier protein